MGHCRSSWSCQSFERLLSPRRTAVFQNRWPYDERCWWWIDKFKSAGKIEENRKKWISDNKNKYPIQWTYDGLEPSFTMPCTNGNMAPHSSNSSSYHWTSTTSEWSSIRLCDENIHICEVPDAQQEQALCQAPRGRRRMTLEIETPIWGDTQGCHLLINFLPCRLAWTRHSWYLWIQFAMIWQQLAAKKRAALAALIPESWRLTSDQLPAESERSVISFFEKSNLLTAEELTITEFKLEPLAQRIANGEYTATQVCQAYCHRAALAHQLVNCLSEINFRAALEQARGLDDYFQTHGRTVGLLHGVPVSLKDQYRVKGLESSIGYISRLNQFDEEESVLTECLRRAGESLQRRIRMQQILLRLGAIIYVKTSVPQSLMIGETISNIFGRTLNPYNRLLSCGGSSGGEGALIACHGSPVGVGTDVGGSVRIPAAFNGLWGIKPSYGRLPLANIAKSLEGQESIHSICGSMAHSARDLAYFMEAVLEQKPWNYDPAVIDMPWRETRYIDGKTNKKTFGVIATDGWVDWDRKEMLQGWRTEWPFAH